MKSNGWETLAGLCFLMATAILIARAQRLESKKPEPLLQKANVEFSATLQHLIRIDVNTPTYKEYSAYVQRDWRIPETYVAGDPLPFFMAGRVTYQVSPRQSDNSPFSNLQAYKWQVDGAGSVFPVPHPSYGLNAAERDLTRSYSSKKVTHNLGDFPAAASFVDTPAEQKAAFQKNQEFFEVAKRFPLTTTMKVWVKPAGAGRVKGVPATIKINWYYPFETHYKVRIKLAGTFPNGEQVIFDEASEQDNLADVPEYQDLLNQIYMVGAMKRLTPRMMSQAGQVVGIVGVVGAAPGTDGRGYAIKTKAVSQRFIQESLPWANRVVTAYEKRQIALGFIEVRDVDWDFDVTVEKLADTGLWTPTQPRLIPNAQPNLDEFFSAAAGDLRPTLIPAPSPNEPSNSSN